MGAALGSWDRLLMGTCLVALGVLAWVCVAQHAPALAAARAPPSLVLVPVLPPVVVAPPPPPPMEQMPPAPPPPPPAPAPVRVQAELDRLLASGRIEFETGSDRLRPEATPLLDAIVAQLASAPDLEVEVEGHTDNRGDPGANRRLSIRRAEAVKAYLATRGIDARRIHTLGSGSTRPILRASTPEAHQLNRRIEFRVIAPGGR